MKGVLRAEHQGLIECITEAAHVVDSALTGLGEKGPLFPFGADVLVRTLCWL